MLAFGVGLMFFAGKVLPSPVPAGSAGGIGLAIAGFVVVVVEALRDPPAPDDPIERPVRTAQLRGQHCFSRL